MAESAAPKSYKKVKKTKKLKKHTKPNTLGKSSKNVVNMCIRRLWPNRKFQKIVKNHYFSIFQTNLTHFLFFNFSVTARELPGGALKRAYNQKDYKTRIILTILHNKYLIILKTFIIRVCILSM